MSRMLSILQNTDRKTRGSSEPPLSMNNVNGSQGLRRALSSATDDFDPTSPIVQTPLRSKSSVSAPVRKALKPSSDFDELAPDSPIDDMPSRTHSVINDMPSSTYSAYPGRMPTSGDEDNDDDEDDDVNDMPSRTYSVCPGRISTNM